MPKRERESDQGETIQFVTKDEYDAMSVLLMPLSIKPTTLGLAEQTGAFLPGAGRKDDIVSLYTGEIMSAKKFNATFPGDQLVERAIKLSTGSYIVAEKDDLASHINHFFPSDVLFTGDPGHSINCQFVELFDIEKRGEFLGIAIQLVKNVPAGKELFIDYGTSKDKTKSHFSPQAEWLRVLDALYYYILEKYGCDHRFERKKFLMGDPTIRLLWCILLKKNDNEIEALYATLITCNITKYSNKGNALLICHVKSKRAGVWSLNPEYVVQGVVRKGVVAPRPQPRPQPLPEEIEDLEELLAAGVVLDSSPPLVAEEYIDIDARLAAGLPVWTEDNDEHHEYGDLGDRKSVV